MSDSKRSRNRINNLTNTYIEINNTSKDEIINTDIGDLKYNFGFDNIVMDNSCLRNMYWLPKMHKTPIKARFIAASHKSTITPLAQTITLAIQLSNKPMKHYNGKWRFFYSNQYLLGRTI